MMRRLRVIGQRLRSLFRRQDAEAEMHREFEFHLAALTQEKLAEGMAPEQARLAARRDLGNIAALEEECRDQRRTRWIEDFVQDFLFGLRMFRRSPVFAMVAVGSLAIAIGANTAIFSLYEALVLRKLAVHEPGELVRVTAQNKAGSTQGSYSMPTVDRLAQEKQLFSHVIAWHNRGIEVGVGAGMRSVAAHLVTPEYFPGTAIRAWKGRLLGDESAEPAVAVVSHRYWQRELGSDPGVIGRVLEAGAVRLTVVGVAPPEFEGMAVGQQPALFLPLAADPVINPGSKMLTMRNASWIQVMARLKPGLAFEQAEEGYRIFWPTLVEETSPTDRNGASWMRELKPLLQPAATGVSSLRQEFKRPLVVLAVAVGFVLLIACVNLASLLMARSHGRQKEVAIRLAVGAGRGRLVRQMLAENLVLAVAGALAGVFLAVFFTNGLLRLLSVGAKPPALDIHFNLPVLAFTAGVTLLATLLFGMAPALGTVRRDLSASMKGRRRLGRAALVTQVALSLVLASGAGLFVLSLRNLVTVAPGFDPQRVLQAEVQPSKAGVKGSEARRFFSDLVERVSRLPEVEAASYSMMTPLRSCCWWDPVKVDGFVPQPGDRMQAHLNRVSPDHFRVMGTRLILGRDFRKGDTAVSMPVAVVNQKFAEHFFAGQEAIGRSFVLYDQRFTIVGIVENSHMRDFRRPMPPTAYMAVDQDKEVPGELILQVRTRSNRPRDAAPLVQKLVHEFNPMIPVETWTMVDEVEETLVMDRVLAALSSFFAIVAVVLGAIGVYGSLSYSASRRTSEIGIRMALGATANQVRWLIMRESAAISIAGVGLGVIGSIALARWIGSFLYRLSPEDPAALAIAGVLVIGASMLAAFLPARRAARIAPLTALRVE